jgi:hypothetical protein
MVKELKCRGTRVWVLMGESGNLPVVEDSRSLLSAEEHANLKAIMKWKVEGKVCKWIIINTLDVGEAEEIFEELGELELVNTIFRVVIMGRCVAYGGWSE